MDLELQIPRSPFSWDAKPLLVICRICDRSLEYHIRGKPDLYYEVLVSQASSSDVKTDRTGAVNRVRSSLLKYWNQTKHQPWELLSTRHWEYCKIFFWRVPASIATSPRYASGDKKGCCALEADVVLEVVGAGSY